MPVVTLRFKTRVSVGASIVVSEFDSHCHSDLIGGLDVHTIVETVAYNVA